MKETKYNFEIVRRMPTERKYLIKQQMKKSLFEQITNMFLGKK
ncbi:MAG: hypothetical protein ACP5N9_03845 [Candidatus Bilamarchaeum sp.]